MFKFIINVKLKQYKSYNLLNCDECKLYPNSKPKL